MTRLALILALALPSLAIASKVAPPTMAKPQSAASKGRSALDREIAKLIRKHLRKARWSLWWPWRKVERAQEEIRMAEELASFHPMSGVLSEIARMKTRVNGKKKATKRTPASGSVVE